jgi:hypothetical protein
MEHGNAEKINTNMNGSWMFNQMQKVQHASSFCQPAVFSELSKRRKPSVDETLIVFFLCGAGSFLVKLF